MRPVQALGRSTLVHWLYDKVSAGFPSPAEGLGYSRLDLDQILDIDPVFDFFMKVAGRSVEAFGIYDGDIVKVRRGKRPANGNMVVVALGPDFLIKKLDIKHGKVTLRAGHPNFKDIVLTEEHEAECWGVVDFSIRVFPSGTINVRPG